MKTIKIQFLLKKPSDNQEILQHIDITEPKIDKSQKFPWGSPYVCEVYLPNMKQNLIAISINPIDTLCQAMEMAKGYLQGFVAAGYTISEVESKEPWILEKLSDNHLENEINKIKNNPNMSQEDKMQILGILKESFGKSPSPIKDQVNRLV